ncbi:exoribonuclease II [Chromatium weissei]|nr:exoribonuclease II [Chromatium weissei]
MLTHQVNPPVDSLVLYKIRPARVVSLGDKIEIELSGGCKRVRPKDIELLHSGPLRSLAELVPQTGEFMAAWELLEGTETTLQELTELAFDAFTPVTAWATWQQVAEGLYFTGQPQAIEVRTREFIERERAEREAKAAAERDWQAFVARMTAAQPTAEDAPRLTEVERLALGQIEHSRVLETLNYAQTPSSAQRMLVKVGYWSPRHNPHSRRYGVPLTDPDLPVPNLPNEERVDFTHLAAYAIDDEGNQDPDDAISVDGDRLWVHVADVAALIAPDSAIDREARARGANLYLPEGVINMLPAAVTEQLGLGLQPISPALSFGFRCDAAGELSDIEICRSWVRVERVSYEAAELRLHELPLAEMHAITNRFRARRVAAGATSLELPDVSIRVIDGEICIRPLPKLNSRGLVMDAMLMAGEAVARRCVELALSIPFATQLAPDGGVEATDLAGMFARRRYFKPTRLSIEPEPHAGSGLMLYTRAISPLRRYSDLLVHQQLRAWLTEQTPLTAQQIMERSGEADLATVAIRRSERFSNQHWKLLFLQENPDWRGEGVVVGLEERKVVVLIPTLALETRIRTREDMALNQVLQLAVTEVDVADLTVIFRILS